MKADIQIVSCPTKQTSTCIGLNFANASYMINCGESTQRLATQNRFRLSKLKSIFTSQISWDNIGGLPGLLLSISEIEPKIQDLKLFGPRNLVKFIAGNSDFVKRPEMTLGISEVLMETQIYEDDNLKVSAAIVLPVGSIAKSGNQRTAVSSKRQKTLQGMFKTTLDNNILNQSDDEFYPTPVLSFVFSLPQVPGKMDGKKAHELGVEGKDRVLIVN